MGLIELHSSMQLDMSVIKGPFNVGDWSSIKED